MAGYDDTTSTEKLLNVIRKNGAESETGMSAPSGGAANDFAPSSMRIKAGRGVCIGVDISYTGLKLASIGKRRQLLECKTVPFGPDVDRTSPNFPQFLKKALREFCGSPRGIELWSTVPSAGVELKYLRIPKLPKKQVSNAVFWTYKKENPFNEREVVFDYDVIGDTVEDGIKKTEVLAYTAPIADIEELKSLFEKAGYPLTGVTAIPFAFQNLFRTGFIPGKETEVCNLYVGRNWSRIDIFSKGNLVLSRGIKAGINSMIDACQEQINSERGGGVEGEIVVQIEGHETPGGDASDPIDGDQARAIFDSFVQGVDAGPQIAGQVFRRNDVFEMVQPALNRLVRQVDRTLEHYRQKLRGDAVSLVYISGGISSCEAVVDYISEQLGAPVEMLDPMGAGMPAPAGGSTAALERAAYGPTVGLALSENELTPNFTYTYKDEEQAEQVKKNQSLVVGGFIVLMALLLGFYLYQGMQLGSKMAEKEDLQKRLAEFVPQVNEEMITEVVNVMNVNRAKMDLYGAKYNGLAVVSEITSSTPPNVRLLNITADFGPNASIGQATEDKNGKKGGEAKKYLNIEGIVSGDKKDIEPALAQYLLSLQVSPLFGKPSVKEQSLRIFEGREVLLFSASVEVM